MRVDINSDIGEGMHDDYAILTFATSVNIACGGHAGNENTIRALSYEALLRNIGIGAHPGYPDREGFGRRILSISKNELRQSIKDQILRVKEIVEKLGGKLQHVKPHGALYNQASQDKVYADMIVDVVIEIDPALILMGQPHSMMQSVALKKGIIFAAEGFADRAYMENGALMPRSESGAVYDDPDQCLKQALQMIESHVVKAHDGERIPMPIETLCVHGDTPSALDIVRKIHEGLSGNGIQIKRMTADEGPTCILKPFGIDGFLFVFGNEISNEISQRVRAFKEALEKSEVSWIRDIVPDYRSVATFINMELIQPVKAVQFLNKIVEQLEIIEKGPRIICHIPTCYGDIYGEDLQFVAQHAGLTKEEVVKRHVSIDYPVHMIGFKPGFPYLGGVDPTLRTPRLETPRVKVPAGSVGIADLQTGIYPLESPGGWHIIGRTPLKFFDATLQDPLLVHMGEYIRFEPIDGEAFRAIAECIKEGTYEIKKSLITGGEALEQD
jgi:UPF0271 protein